MIHFDKIKNICTAIHRKCIKLRLTPIRVYCLHHVCRVFDEKTMCKGDWENIDKFKRMIIMMRNHGVEFISMSEAAKKMRSDFVRTKHYAVLTFDDGYASMKEVLPWLMENNIPIVLFINGKYLDGKSYRDYPTEKYLTKVDMGNLNSQLVEIGHHGWEHVDSSTLSSQSFLSQIKKNIDALSIYPMYIPFWAYTWGRHSKSNDKILVENNLIAVLMDGGTNYNGTQYIHRELLFGNNYDEC